MGQNDSEATKRLEDRTFRPDEVGEIIPNSPSPNALRKWVDSERLVLSRPPKSGTMTRYAYKDLPRVTAWAELNRIGIVPDRAPVLLEVLEKELGGTPEGFVVAWVLDRLDDEPEVVRMRVRTVKREGLRFVFMEAQPGQVADVTSILVIDAAKLQRQLNESLKAFEAKS